MVEARGVVIATVFAALVVIGLLAYAASAFAPSTVKHQACQNHQLPASECF